MAAAAGSLIQTSNSQTKSPGMSREALRVQQGSLYPALHRLEYKKLLTSNWQASETGREDKFYELTAKGRAHLKAETENWKRLTDVVGLILKGTLEGIS